MNHRLRIFLALCLILSARTEAQLRWGEFGYFSNWERSSDADVSRYEFSTRLPELSNFPKILDAALDPRLGDSDRKIAISQLRTLSRCNFEKVLNADSDEKAEARAAVGKWRQWWLDYGKNLAATLAAQGKKREAAWKRIAPSPCLECPFYPILIPDSWTTTVLFRSGDYGGVTEEILEIRVKGNDCTLSRKYGTGWPDKFEWTRETWKGFSRKDADLFYGVLVYAIDHPWFLARDELSDKQEKESPAIGHILKRPEQWTDYYPHVEWPGILDGNRKIIMNHDAWNWLSIDYGMTPKTSFDEPVGVIFRVIRDLFPDPSYDPDNSRWTRVEKETER